MPVYVTRQNVDLQICMLDRLYQDSIVVKNRYASACTIINDSISILLITAGVIGACTKLRFLLTVLCYMLADTCRKAKPKQDACLA